MMRAFVNEITARSRCVRVFVKQRSVAYVPISCLPHMAIMCHHERGSNDIFRPHTEIFACRRCPCFIPWTAGVNIFSVNVKADFVTSTLLLQVAHGDAMVAREQRCEYILRAKKTS
jgi:hypothetical protein